ncbi:discoidin domain-containing protein [Jiangella asiatica]|uniref:Discoidin domain-containing protein n=1 Tax=Jiangella asiatica TaxID=2530372 RepID=A0A4R5CBA1_9ACTN|nr:discoidin domain-containing protein [Jiangella asiatica]TDD94384.1 discoidin domain-containing protein [Jiangella asiatica]
MRKRQLGVIALAAVVLGVAGAAASTAARPDRDPVRLSATPERVEVVGLPCLPSSIQLGLTNTSTADLYADAELTAAGPVMLDRALVSSWLPAWEPDHTVTAWVGVTAPRDAAPGVYEVGVTTDGARLTVAVEVLPLPPKGPADNQALGEQATASSTHANFDVCGAVDGNTDSDQWDTATGWNDGTSGTFPDTYDVALAGPVAVGRIETWTLDSTRYPAARYGLRDFDVQVRVDGAWRTVDAVRGNSAGHVTSTFAPVTADAVRIVGLASNNGDYSRLVEIEAFAG